MEADPLYPPPPPCGLTRQEIERYHVEGICQSWPHKEIYRPVNENVLWCKVLEFDAHE